MPKRRTSSAAIGRKAKRSVYSRVCGEDVCVPYTPDEVGQLLDILNLNRVDEYIKPISLTLAKLGSPFKKTFIEYFSRSLEFEPHEAGKVWSDAQQAASDDSKDMHLLLDMANDDDSEALSKWFERVIPSFALNRYQGEHRGLAEIAHFVLKDCLKSADLGGKEVFYLLDPESAVWRKHDEKSFAVKRRISYALEGILRKIIDKLRYSALSDSSGDDGEEDDVCEWEEVEKTVIDIRKGNILTAIVRAGWDLFRDQQFVQSLDSIPNLLGVMNGMVDLETGILRPIKPEDSVSTLATAAYDPTADTKEVSKIVKHIMADDEGMAAYLQMLLGYCIIGGSHEEVFIIFTKNGRNGKGLLIHALQVLLGGFFRSMNTNIIAGKSGTNVDAQLIDGIGARIWSFNETYENAQLRSDTVKMISGRGIMTVKARGQTIEVSPHQTCIVTTNHLPRLGTVNEALKQRLICIEFPVTFKDLLAGEEETLLSRRRDTNLKSWFEVAENKTAFLKYLVDGSIEYQKRCGGDSGSGLKSHAPKAVLDFTEKYLYDHDIIQQFLDAKCDIGTDYKESATLLRTSYERYFNVKISYNCLKKLLEGKGHLSMQNCVPGGLNGYMGLRLKR